MSEIKPCPFCGSTSISIQEGSTFRWMLACCNDCDAKSGEIRVDTLNNRRADALEKARRDAITKWNERAK